MWAFAHGCICAGSEVIKWGGDFRTGYYGSDTDKRDGTNSSSRSGRARVRYGFKAPINEHWSGQLRHRYQFNKHMRLESRLRNRVELEQKTAAVRRQDSNDFYVRFTWKL